MGAKVSFRPPRIGEKFSVDVILREFERQNPKFFSRFRRDFPKTTEFTPELREKSGIFLNIMLLAVKNVQFKTSEIFSAPARFI